MANKAGLTLLLLAIVAQTGCMRSVDCASMRISLGGEIRGAAREANSGLHLELRAKPEKRLNPETVPVSPGPFHLDLTFALTSEDLRDCSARPEVLRVALVSGGKTLDETELRFPQDYEEVGTLTYRPKSGIVLRAQ